MGNDPVALGQILISQRAGLGDKITVEDIGSFEGDQSSIWERAARMVVAVPGALNPEALHADAFAELS